MTSSKSDFTPFPLFSFCKKSKTIDDLISVEKDEGKKKQFEVAMQIPSEILWSISKCEIYNPIKEGLNRVNFKFNICVNENQNLK